VIYAKSLVVATGGLSVPKIGATSMGYDIARQFGIGIVQTRPALVPLVLAEEDQRNFCDLAGISAGAIVTAGAHSFREKLLITHGGISGPAGLQASLYWHPEGPLLIDLAPGMDLTRDIRTSPSGRDTAALVRALQRALAVRLAERWIALHPPPDWTNRSLEALANSLHQWELRPAGTEGLAKAEVTAGGVDTAELSAQTLESKRVPGLFFIGEVVDVTGQLGGFNFQWAWASAAAAGRELAARFSSS
jgi:predicted Rossmann fold flavoprotein